MPYDNALSDQKNDTFFNSRPNSYPRIFLTLWTSYASNGQKMYYIQKIIHEYLYNILNKIRKNGHHAMLKGGSRITSDKCFEFTAFSGHFLAFLGRFMNFML